ncbi:MAG: sensor histidine kinase [Coprobacillus cateniformis]
MSLVVSLCVSNAKYYEKNLEQSLRLEAYDYEDKYIDAITERTVEYNKLRHDMKNHFDIVERMINTSHIQEAKDYMEQISFDQGEHYVHVNHLVLNYILSNKTKLAKSHGIDLCSVIIGKPVTFIADVDYSILVGNLLDNAIEATIEAKENEVNLCLSFYEDRFVIEVKNCVVDKPKSKQLLTNKKDKSKHGIGLKNIKDIVEKYNGQDVIEVNGNVFYHMCILYKVDEK